MDLAQATPRDDDLPKVTVNRSTTLPRPDTAQPVKEVNAVIHTPAQDNAAQLSHLLNLATDLAANIGGDLAAKQRADDTAAGALDAAAGTSDPKKLANVRAYRDAWQLQGVKKLATDIGDEASQWASNRLNDTDHPATLAEIDQGVESIFQKHVTDPTGKLLNFGPAEAKTTLANALDEVRSTLLPQAQATIKKQTDGTFLSMWSQNVVHEFYRAAPIGVNRGLLNDPLAPLPAPLPEEGAPGVSRTFDVEAALKQVPAAIDKGTAKEFLIQSLINEARDSHDLSALNGLENSKRADGTPSFTPDEAATIIGTRQKLADTFRKQAKDARDDLWQENENRVLLAVESDVIPSAEWLSTAAHRGLIDPQFAFTLTNHFAEQTRLEASQARLESREAAAEANAGYDADVAGEVAQRQAGLVGAASAEADLELLRTGKLGSGKQGLMRYKELRAAAQLGEQQNLRNPEVAVYAGQLRQNFAKAPSDFVSKAMQGRNGGINVLGMMSFYKDKVAKGEAPSIAYFETVQKFAPQSKATSAARDQRIQELRAKAALP